MKQDDPTNKIIKAISKGNKTTEEIAQTTGLCEYDIIPVLFELEETGKIIPKKWKGYIYPHCNQPRFDQIFGLAPELRRELAQLGKL